MEEQVKQALLKTLHTKMKNKHGNTVVDLRKKKDKDRSAYMEGDALCGAFLTYKPYQVVCADTTDLKVTFTNSPKLGAKMLLAVDIATSRILYFRIAETITQYDTLAMVERIDNQVNDFWSKKSGSPLHDGGSRAGWLLHTDRGGEFASEEVFTFFSKSKWYDHSMTPPHRPSMNGVVERLFRSLKYQLKDIWMMVHKDENEPSMPLNFDSLDDLRYKLGEWIRLYNKHHKIKSKGHLPPAELEDALCLLDFNLDKPIRRWLCTAGSALENSKCFKEKFTFLLSRSRGY